MQGGRRWYFWCGLVVLLASAALLLCAADRRTLLLAGNSLWVGLGACAVSVPLGTVLALVLTRTDLPGRRMVFGLLASLLFLPLYLHAAAWDAGFGQLGWYSTLRDLVPAPWLRGAGAVVWIHGLWSVPWVTVIVSAALHWSEPELEEAALLDATVVQVFVRVTLRRALSGVLIATAWVLLAAIGDMTVTDLYQVRTLAEEIYTCYALGDDTATRLGLHTALLVTGALSGAALMFLDRLLTLAQQLPRRAPLVFSLGRWRWLVVAWVVLVLLLLIAVPLGNLVYQAGLVVRSAAGVPVRHWSLARCLELLVPWPATYRYAAVWEFRRPLCWTLAIGLSAATLAVTTAAPLAWLARRGGLRAMPAIVLAAGGIGVLGPLVGVVLLQLMTAHDLPGLIWLRDQTILAPVLATTWRSLPPAIVICWLAFSSINQAMFDAAQVDGAGWRTQFVHIGVRLRMPALVVAWLVSLATACGELPASILVVPAGVTTVPIRVFGLLHAGVTNQAAAICLTSIVGFLLVATAIQWLIAVVLRRAARATAP